MDNEAPTLPYEPAKRANPWAKTSLISGIVFMIGAFVPICGLAVVPLAWLGVIAGLIGVSLAIWGKRRGLASSIFGSMRCLAAAFIPIGMLGAVPFLAELGLKFWASNQTPPTTAPAMPSTLPTTTTAPTDQ